LDLPVAAPKERRRRLRADKAMLLFPGRWQEASARDEVNTVPPHGKQPPLTGEKITEEKP